MPNKATEDEDSIKHLLVRLPADLHEAVKRRAEDEERSMAQTIRHALRRYLEERPAS